MLVRIWLNKDKLTANNTALQNINNTLNNESSKRDDEITKLRQEIASLDKQVSQHRRLYRKRGHPGVTSSDYDPTGSDSGPQ